MAQYEVTLPITGIMFLTVEAESEEDAISKAQDEAVLSCLEEWESHEHIVQGNVFYGVKNEAEAIKVSD